MGDITLSQIQTEVLYNLKNRSDTSLTTARMYRWINAAYRHMCLPSVHMFEELKVTYDITLVAGTYQHSLSAATLGFNLVYLRSAHHVQATAAAETGTTQKRKLSPRNIRWFDRRTLTTGPPTIWSCDGQTLYLSPIPTSDETNQLLRTRLVREPATLTATDTTVLPVYYDEVLIIGAQWMAERALGYTEKAELTKQDYVAMLNEGSESYELEAEDWDSHVDINPHAQEMM